MPQLDPTWYVSQMFWLCVCFFTMLFIMSHFIVPRIADILDKRRTKIDDYLYKAGENKRLAEKSLENYHKAIAEATDKATAAIEEMHKELDRVVSEKQVSLSEKLSKQIKESEAKINKSKEDALAKMRDISDGLAWDVVSKIGLKNIDRKDIKHAVNDVAEAGE